MPSKDPNYQKQYIRKHYQLNKQYYLDKNKKNKTIAVKRAKRLTRLYKYICGCKHCGYKTNVAALQFHHLGDKERAIGTMVAEGRSVAQIKKEIRKCIVLCANCHLILHSQDGTP